ncbi:hypothetical protein LSM04_008531 [Trypanosoma melophagium]|uniref:uncharacterized protein n=1 Tax=Trypanosoma melophagium TaxID=715481 RepID=UPI00351AA33F|nr:hypothetical protein LSM04_008531 [Trypanosoma melophagium]
MLSSSRLFSRAGAAEPIVPYRKGSYHIVPKKHTVGRRIAVRNYLDRNRTELSDRTYMPQKAWFEAYAPKQFERDHERLSHNFYNIETKLIWTAFDTPELIGILLHDETIKGATHLYSAEFLDAALHWTRECRYWRCIGITKPFYDKHTLRAHCWHDKGMQVGTLVFSQAMRHALMDLERAVRRKELGLQPNYVWDRWGPIGFIDGTQADYLPRFAHNPYIDPDGVEVTELDVAPFNTHEQIKERYAEFIEPDLRPFEGVFRAPSHGGLTLDDMPNQEVVELYRELKAKSGSPVVLAGGAEIPPADMRALFYLTVDADLLREARALDSWTAVREMLQPVQEVHDEKVEALRLLENTRYDAGRVRSFLEEKCGFADFSRTPDAVITAAVLCALQELRRVACETPWGPAAIAMKGEGLWRRREEKKEEQVGADQVGELAVEVTRCVEGALRDKRRRLWATRFAADAREESTLDFLLENFGRRAEPARNAGTTGTEFDREQEPIGRQVQRRVVDADKAQKLAEARQQKGRMWSKKKSVFDSLHQKQTQNFTYGVR